MPADSPASDPDLPVIDPASFEGRVLGSPMPVIVDFFASWCGPCEWIVPTLRAVRNRHSGRILVVKVDIDAAPELAERFRIGSVPTIVLFREGLEVERSVGVEPRKVEAMAAAVADSAEDVEGPSS